jgi:hypothetical protein
MLIPTPEKIKKQTATIRILKQNKKIEIKNAKLGSI